MTPLLPTPSPGKQDFFIPLSLLTDNNGNPIKIINGYFEGDKFRPVLQDINPNVVDTAGRRFPGNPDAASNTQTTLCRSDTAGQSIFVRIADSCPCTQVGRAAELAMLGCHVHWPCTSCGEVQIVPEPPAVPARISVYGNTLSKAALKVWWRTPIHYAVVTITWPNTQTWSPITTTPRSTQCACVNAHPTLQVLKEGDPGVAKGGETRTQQWCCGAKGLQHFDVSYDAFEKLTHPVYGEWPLRQSTAHASKLKMW